jgi:hypothetical protein
LKKDAFGNGDDDSQIKAYCDSEPKCIIYSYNPTNRKWDCASENASKGALEEGAKYKTKEDIKFGGVVPMSSCDKGIKIPDMTVNYREKLHTSDPFINIQASCGGKLVLPTVGT